MNGSGSPCLELNMWKAEQPDFFPVPLPLPPLTLQVPVSAVQAAGRKSEQYTPDATCFSGCTPSGVSAKVIGHGGRVSPKLEAPARQWQRPDCISLPRRSDCPGNGVWGGG